MGQEHMIPMEDLHLRGLADRGQLDYYTASPKAMTSMFRCAQNYTPEIKDIKSSFLPNIRKYIHLVWLPIWSQNTTRHGFNVIGLGRAPCSPAAFYWHWDTILAEQTELPCPVKA